MIFGEVTLKRSLECYLSLYLFCITPKRQRGFNILEYFNLYSCNFFTHCKSFYFSLNYLLYSQVFLFYKKYYLYKHYLKCFGLYWTNLSPIFSEKFFDSKIWCTNLISNFNLNNSCNDLLAGNMIEFKLNASYLDTVQYTFSNLTSYTFINYLVLFLIANLYLFKTDFFLENKKELSLIYFLFLPLFVTALDWGRWLYIFIFLLVYYLYFFAK